MQKLLFISFLILLNFYTALRPEGAAAQDMDSQNYKLQGGNFNMSGGVGNSQNFTLVDLVGQNSAQIFASKGYLLNSGFLNRAGASNLTFSISPLSVNFGRLTPGKISSDSLIITAASGELPGFRIFVSQNRPLSTESGAEIPDAVCNAAKSGTCSPTNAALWTNAASYGFGYNLEGSSLPKDFKNRDFYRPFASSFKKEKAALILESVQKKDSKTLKMNLKISVSQSQPVGVYQNILNFAILPGI